MIFDFEYDDDITLKSLVLLPDKKEDPDELYVLSRQLPVTNPAIAFTEKAKRGDYNAISDPDYQTILERTKLVSSHIFGNQPSINIFRLAVSLMEIIMDPEMVELKDKAKVLISKPPKT